MELIRKFLNSLKTERSKAAKVKNTAPTYFSDMKWYQNPEKSIVTDDNRYDLNNFSEHEIDTIIHVIKVVKKNILSNYGQWDLRMKMSQSNINQDTCCGKY